MKRLRQQISPKLPSCGNARANLESSVALIIFSTTLFLRSRAVLESIGRRFTSCDDGTLSAYEHLSRCVYTPSDAARHIFAPLQYITALVPAVHGSRVYIVNIRRDPRRINNIRIAARRAPIGPLLLVTLSRQSSL